MTQEHPQTDLPVLFLDVDGVLNAYALDPILAGFDDFEVHEVTIGDDTGFRMTLDLRLSPGMGQALATLPAEIVWLTTWEHNADQLIAPLVGLPRGLRVLSPPSGAKTGTPLWKLDALRQSVSLNPTPFVWLDDDLNLFRAAVSAEKWASELPVPSLLIAPDPRAGILPEDIEAIEEFLAAHG